MLTEPDILEALTVCYDPELRINVVDLGRIHAIRIEHDTEAPGVDPRHRVALQLLPRNEEHDSILAALITNRLLGIRDISRAEVTYLEAPAWTPDRMSPEAKRELGKQRGLIQLG